MNQKVDIVIENIEKNLFQTIKNKKNNYIGLYSGVSGVALFYAYYFKYKKKFNQNLSQIIVDTLETINHKTILDNYYEGITGFAWLLEHLVQNEFIDGDDVEDILNDFDEIITKHLNKEIKIFNFDFLYGAIGVGNYFLLRNKRKDFTKQLDSIVYALKESAVKDEVGIKWKSPDQIDLIQYNYGFAHGQISIIAFLNKLIKYNHSYKKDVIHNLLKPTIEHILSKEINKDKKDINRFMLTDIYNTKLNKKITLENSPWGWCYGDLIIAWTLYNSAKLLNDSKLKDKVNEIMIYSSKRRDLKPNQISDVYFCHGASSIFHIFNKYNQENNNKEFEETLNFWLNQILSMFTNKSNISGKKNNLSNLNWLNEYSLLLGNSGVGLTLISHLQPELMTWDECFLLS